MIERFLKVFGKDGDVALSAAVKFGVEVKIYKTFMKNSNFKFFLKNVYQGIGWK